MIVLIYLWIEFLDDWSYYNTFESNYYTIASQSNSSTIKSNYNTINRIEYTNDVNRIFGLEFDLKWRRFEDDLKTIWIRFEFDFNTISIIRSKSTYIVIHRAVYPPPPDEKLPKGKLLIHILTKCNWLYRWRDNVMIFRSDQVQTDVLFYVHY